MNLGTKWEDTIRVISEKYRGVILGHSGGPDSTALFHLFYEVTKRKKNFSLSLYHMNFGLRDNDSEEDELFSRDLAARFGVDFHCDRVEGSNQELRNGESLQEWARRLRYQAFDSWVKKGWVVALGHHQEDVAENVLLRLTRGSSVGRLAGMHTFKDQYWRPLLHTKKAELLQYLEKNGHAYRKDLSNDKIDYSRNLIRHQIIPELDKLQSGSSERIALAGIEAQELSLWCQSRLRADMADLSADMVLGYLKDLPRAVCYEALNLLINADGVHRQLTRALLSEAWVQIQSETQGNWARDVAEGLRLTISGGLLKVEAQNTKGVRSQQHRATHSPVNMQMLLNPNSHAIFKVRGAKWKITNLGSQCRLIDAHSLQTSEELEFANGKCISAKKLLQKWDICSQKRQNMVVVNSGTKTLGVFDGESLLELSENGSPTKLSNLLVSIIEDSPA